MKVLLPKGSLKFIAVFIIFFEFFSFAGFAQDDVSGEDVKMSLEKIFKLSADTNYVELCNYVVYMRFGENSARSGNDVCRADSIMEFEQIKRLSNKINTEYLALGNREYLEFMSQEQDDKKWYVWKIRFYNDLMTKNVYFAMLIINGKFAIGDID